MMPASPDIEVSKVAAQQPDEQTMIGAVFSPTI